MPALSNSISTSRLIRQYLRWLPAQLGLVNKAAFHLQIKAILPTDTFIVSFPKSGNTWLRFIMAYLITGAKTELTFKEVEQLIPDVYFSKDRIDAMPNPRFIKTHDPLFSFYPKSIYIYRDYRDVLVSYFHYKLALGEFTGDFSTFIRSSEVVIPFGSWKLSVKAALLFAQNNANRIRLVKYENLLANTAQEITAIAQFAGVRNFNASLINELTQFVKLKELEIKTGSLFMDKSGANFFREGKEDVWRSYFTAADLTYLWADTELLELFHKLDYTTD